MKKHVFFLDFYTVQCPMPNFFQFKRPFHIITEIEVKSSASSGDSKTACLLSQDDADKQTSSLQTIHKVITKGAKSFLNAEYKYCFIFVAVFAVIVYILVLWGLSSSQMGFYTVLSFVLGALTSMASGYLGMMVAVYLNAHTTVSAQAGG